MERQKQYDDKFSEILDKQYACFTAAGAEKDRQFNERIGSSAWQGPQKVYDGVLPDWNSIGPGLIGAIAKRIAGRSAFGGFIEGTQNPVDVLGPPHAVHASKNLAAIFGGPDSIMRTALDVDGQYRGRNPRIGRSGWRQPLRRRSKLLIRQSCAVISSCVLQFRAGRSSGDTTKNCWSHASMSCGLR